MRFDWRRFLEENAIEHITSGPHTSRGNANIRCPFCGSSHEGFLLGVSLDPNKPYWNCWRRADHRGRDPTRLVAELKGWSYQQAKAYMEVMGENPDEFESAIALLSSGEGVEAVGAVRSRDSIRLLPEFRGFDQQFTSEIRFRSYLKQRGFQEVDSLVKAFNLKWCVSGMYAQRIIIPYYHHKRLVTWTGRALGKGGMRYLSLPKEECVMDPKQMLFMRRTILPVKGDTLVLVEGPFDAIKLDFFGREHGMIAAAISGLSLSPEQLIELHRLVPRFKRVVVMLDDTAELEGGIIISQVEEVLGTKAYNAIRLLRGRKDAGELDPQEVVNIAHQLQRK